MLCFQPANCFLGLSSVPRLLAQEWTAGLPNHTLTEGHFRGRTRWLVTPSMLMPRCTEQQCLWEGKYNQPQHPTLEGRIQHTSLLLVHLNIFHGVPYWNRDHIFLIYFLRKVSRPHTPSIEISITWALPVNDGFAHFVFIREGKFRF